MHKIKFSTTYVKTGFLENQFTDIRFSGFLNPVLQDIRIRLIWSDFACQNTQLKKINLQIRLFSTKLCSIISKTVN